MTPNPLPGPPPCSTGFSGNPDVTGFTKSSGRGEVRRRTILCVDDRLVFDLQRALLEAAGFSVETISDPHEALRTYSRKGPDAVVIHVESGESFGVRKARGPSVSTSTSEGNGEGKREETYRDGRL